MSGTPRAPTYPPTPDTLRVRPHSAPRVSTELDVPTRTCAYVYTRVWVCTCVCVSTRARVSGPGGKPWTSPRTTVREFFHHPRHTHRRRVSSGTGVDGVFPVLVGKRTVDPPDPTPGPELLRVPVCVTGVRPVTPVLPGPRSLPGDRRSRRVRSSLVVHPVTAEGTSQTPTRDPPLSHRLGFRCGQRREAREGREERAVSDRRGLSKFVTGTADSLLPLLLRPRRPRPRPRPRPRSRPTSQGPRPHHGVPQGAGVDLVPLGTR